MTAKLPTLKELDDVFKFEERPNSTIRIDNREVQQLRIEVFVLKYQDVLLSSREREKGINFPLSTIAALKLYARLAFALERLLSKPEEPQKNGIFSGAFFGSSELGGTNPNAVGNTSSFQRAFGGGPYYPSEIRENAGIAKAAEELRKHPSYTGSSAERWDCVNRP